MWGCGHTCHTLPTVSGKKCGSRSFCGHWSGIFSRVASDLREETDVACGSCGASTFFAACPGRFVFSQSGLHRIFFAQFMITSIPKRRGKERHIKERHVERTKRRRASQAKIRQEASFPHGAFRPISFGGEKMLFHTVAFDLDVETCPRPPFGGRETVHSLAETTPAKCVLSQASAFFAEKRHRERQGEP